MGLKSKQKIWFCCFKSLLISLPINFNHSDSVNVKTFTPSILLYLKGYPQSGVTIL